MMVIADPRDASASKNLFISPVTWNEPVPGVLYLGVRHLGHGGEGLSLDLRLGLQQDHLDDDHNDCDQCDCHHRYQNSHVVQELLQRNKNF